MKQFIICPNCGAIELATVIKNELTWWTYIHHCSKCEYIIMESEWQLAKAISIKQPWSFLIASGVKDIENRTWKTKFRGRVLIHVGEKPMKMINPSDVFTRDQWDVFNINEKTQLMCTGTSFKPLSTSCILGSVEIVDCIQNSDSIWAEKAEEYNPEIHDRIPRVWHWVLKDPVLFEKPILNVKGKLSFFTPEIPSNHVD